MVIVKIAGFAKFADFNPPRKGERIIVNSPRGLYTRDPYWLVVNVSGNAREGWNATIRGSNGETQNLHSSDVTSWEGYRGDPYPWETQEAEERKRKAQEAEQQKILQQHQDQIAAISQNYKFPTGDPLAVPQGGLLVNVNENATGTLDLFASKPLMIVSINPANETVKMSPVLKDDPSLAEFAEFIQAVPAAEVVQNTSPVVPVMVSKRQVSVPDLAAQPDEKGKRPSKKIMESQIPSMVPHFVEAVLRGQVTGPYRNGEFARVFVNYDQNKGVEKFMEEMRSYGIPITEDEIELDNARFKVYDNGMKSPMHYYTGAVQVNNPSDALIEELKGVAPASQIIQRGDGVIVYSNTLFRLLMKLRKPTSVAAGKTNIVVKIAGFASRPLSA